MDAVLTSVTCSVSANGRLVHPVWHFSVSGNGWLHLHLLSFRQWQIRSGSAFGQFPAITYYIWFCICSVSGNGGLHPVLNLFRFRQLPTTSSSAFVQFPAMICTRSGFAFVRFPAMTDYICIWSVYGNGGLHPFLHVFSIRLWPSRSGSAFVYFSAMTDYIQFCICSVSNNDGLHPILNLFSFRQWTDYIRFCICLVMTY